MTEMTRYAALLLSRQAIQPSGQDSWVQNVSAAIKWLKQRQLGLISSVAMPTWELVTAVASAENLPLKLVLLAADQHEFKQQITKLVYEFDLDQNLTEFSLCCKSGGKKNLTEDYHKRDSMIAETADLLLPISIRQSGSMSRMIKQIEAAGKQVNWQFELPYQRRTEPLGYSIDKNNLNPKLEAIAADYLIHWTRASSSAWPDEREIDYYQAVVDSTEFPRLALATLRHIVKTGKLIASGRHMPEGIKTVSYSEANPLEIIDLIRWRARYRMMSFEPYGIGIKRSLAAELGIRAVEYYDRSEKTTPSTTAAWLRQSQGRLTDWRNEKEHRSLGDFDLKALPLDQLLLICRTQEEAVLLTDEFKIRAVSFLS